MTTKTKTRERWLLDAADLLRKEIFTPKGHEVPTNIRVSLGFPSVRALSSNNARVGECWDKRASSDEHSEIWISPRVGDKPARVIDILAHEMIHAMGHNDHKAGFRKVAKSIGLGGKMTATKAEPELAEWCEGAAKRIGPWPGGKITAANRGTKKQTTRLLKAACPECGYTIRVTKKWADLGLPTCPCGVEMDRA